MVFFTFALIQEERKVARIGRFGGRWNRLTAIHDLVRNECLSPLDAICGQLTPMEYSRLVQYAAGMGEWFNAINANINNARQNQLSRYATANKTAAMKAIGLCKKYNVYRDIEKFEYSARRKMIILNGRDLYYLG